MPFESHSPADTARLAATLAASLRGGDCLALYGALGAGKTVFAAALKDALGALGEMQSPTFTMLRSYEQQGGGPAFHHFDAYRLSGPEEWYDLGFSEVIEDGGIALIEWADVVEAALPERTIRIRIDKVPEDENKRLIRLIFPEGDARADLSV